MRRDVPANEFVTGFGEVIQYAYNLKGEPVGPRNRTGFTTTGVHYSNTDVNGNYTVANGPPTQADWLMQSLCSAHLEEKHQWGPEIGVEDDMFMTNEEWMTYEPGSKFVGIPAHVIDLATSTAYAIGAFTQSGFEKIVEINSMHKDYVAFVLGGKYR
jgi:hypothetical protein